MHLSSVSDRGTSQDIVKDIRCPTHPYIMLSRPYLNNLGYYKKGTFCISPAANRSSSNSCSTSSAAGSELGSSATLSVTPNARSSSSDEDREPGSDPGILPVLRFLKRRRRPA